jgi:hypothetical protein
METGVTPGLFFCPAPFLSLEQVPLLWAHADLRVSVRTMRARVRTAGGLRSLAGDRLSGLRLEEAEEEVFRVRVHKRR